MLDYRQLKNDTAANWAASNVILKQGEFGLENDTIKLKIGDGKTAWNSLSYFASSGAGLPAGGTAGQVLEKIDSVDYNTQWVNLPDLSGYLTSSDAAATYVPYSGATGDVNLNTRQLFLQNPNRAINIATDGNSEIGLNDIDLITVGTDYYYNYYGQSPKIKWLSGAGGFAMVDDSYNYYSLTVGTLYAIDSIYGSFYGNYYGSTISDTYISSAATWSAKANYSFGSNNFSGTGTMQSGGFIGPYIAPASNSTTALQIRKADKTTSVLDVDTTNSRIGVGTVAPNAKLEILATTEQLRAAYNASNYMSITVGSSGSVQLSATGSAPYLVLNPKIYQNNTIYGQYKPFNGLSLFESASSTTELFSVIGSYNIAHHADDWHVVTNTNISNANRLYNPESNLNLNAQWGGGTSVATTEVDVSGSIGGWYGRTVFKIFYSTTQTLSNVLIEWWDNAAVTWRTFYNATPTLNSEGYLVANGVIGFSQPANKWRITSTLAANSTYPQDSIGHISVLNASSSIRGQFASVIPQGGDVYLPLTVGAAANHKGHIHYQDSIKEYFGTGKDASIYYDGTNLYINPVEVGSGKLILSGNFSLADGKNIDVGTGTGTKIGTSASQKIGFWNVTPIAQPTTAYAAATLVGGGGATITDTDTFDGYTIKQIVKALRGIGVLA